MGFVDIKKYPLRKSHPHLQPARVEEELQQGEDGDVKVEVVALVSLGGVEELTTNQTSKEKGVDSKSDDLKRQRYYRDFTVRPSAPLCGRLRALIGLQ